MSMWIIERTGSRVKLAYAREPLAEKPLLQHCGEGDAVLESDLEAWVFEQAEPWDLVRTPRGLFARQHAVAQDRLPERAYEGSAAAA
jgi:hypothetical protein